MMAAATQFSNLMRVTFLRGSPERIPYRRKLFIAMLLLALLASGGVQAWFFGDHVVFVLLRVFAELVVFMLWMVLLTARVARLRLVTAMLCLVMISVFEDAMLIAVSPLTLGDWEVLVSGLWAVMVGYGAASVAAWAQQAAFPVGLAQVVAYALGVTAVDWGFRALYQMVAGG